MRAAYVLFIRALRPVLRVFGVLSWLERRSERRIFLYLRSLLAIYDVDDMVLLDLPWWSFDATSAVEQFLEGRDAVAFEYGSGASTIWLAQRCQRVVSVEHDRDWHDTLATRVAQTPNVTVLLRPPVALDGGPPPRGARYASEKPGWDHLSFESFVRAIEEQDEAFDLIVIDGRARQDCLEVAIRALKPDGVILFDDTLRDRYRAAIDRCDGLRAEYHFGLTATLPYRNETALLTARSQQDTSPDHSRDSRT